MKKTHDWIAPVNTLDVHGENLIDDAKLKQIIKENESLVDAQRWVAVLSLKGRDLRGINLSDADVRHIDFSGAKLNGALLSRAWAEDAHINEGAQLQGASLKQAQLQGVSPRRRTAPGRVA